MSLLFTVCYDYSAKDPFNFDADSELVIFFNRTRIFYFFLVFFFMLKLDEPFSDEEIFYNISFFNSLRTKNCCYFAPWIRIRILIQKAKMLWIQRIRILITYE